MKNIIKYFIAKSSLKETNFFTTIGTAIILISLSLPYFRIPYSITEHTITPLEFLARFFIFKIETSKLTMLSILYVTFASILSFVLPKQVSAILALVGVIFLIVSLYFYYVPVERFCFGIAFTIAGLALMLTGFFNNR